VKLGKNNLTQQLESSSSSAIVDQSRLKELVGHSIGSAIRRRANKTLIIIKIVSSRCHLPRIELRLDRAGQERTASSTPPEQGDRDDAEKM
jgi:hypothetical protein